MSARFGIVTLYFQLLGFVYLVSLTLEGDTTGLFVHWYHPNPHAVAFFGHDIKLVGYNVLLVAQYFILFTASAA